MTAYRRVRVPGATYFFTLCLEDRLSSALTDHADALRAAFLKTQAERPFYCDAIVVLPDHLHAIWTLPEGDTDFSTRWRLIKARFVRETGLSGLRRRSHLKKGERGVWQRRFWEHAIRDEADHRAHVEYCWANPVRHGLVVRPVDWPFSSIHRDIRAGRVDAEWIGDCDAIRAGEPEMGAKHPSYSAV